MTCWMSNYEKLTSNLHILKVLIIEHKLVLSKHMHLLCVSIWHFCLKLKISFDIQIIRYLLYKSSYVVVVVVVVVIVVVTFSEVTVLDSAIREKMVAQSALFVSTESNTFLGADPIIDCMLDTIVGSSWVPRSWHLSINTFPCSKDGKQWHVHNSYCITKVKVCILYSQVSVEHQSVSQIHKMTRRPM